MADDLKYWLGFNIVKGIGGAKLQALYDYFGGNLGTAWHASELQLQKIGLDKRAINSFIKTRAELDLDSTLAAVLARSIQLVSWDSPNYPSYLREISGAPPLLYVQGELQEIDRLAVAVVGTRRLTAYGRQVTRDLVSGLVHNGVTIISGLARGIDAIAHKTALELGGRTIGVLGSGLNHIYPAENRKVAQQIWDGQGAIITEYALDVKPEGKNFPPRNRLISGLSLGVMVVEAAERSGALITANFALEQGRDVFAVPGNINSVASQGPNRLIQDGAKLVTSVDDILNELNLQMVAEQTAVQKIIPDSEEESIIIASLSHQPRHIDELRRDTGLESSIVSSTLTLLELKGIVQQVGGMNYVLSKH